MGAVQVSALRHLILRPCPSGPQLPIWSEQFIGHNCWLPVYPTLVLRQSAQGNHRPSLTHPSDLQPSIVLSFFVFGPLISQDWL
jgi:hypothetical protein